MTQQIQTEVLTRTIRAQKAENLDMEPPTVASRKANLLGFTSTGLPTAVVPGATGGDVSLGAVLSTGSGTSRTLAERFAEIINVNDYGASTSASAADNTTAFTTAVEALPATGGTIFVPEVGTYNHNGITLKAGVKWVCASRGGTILNNAGTGVAVDLLSQAKRHEYGAR